MWLSFKYESQNVEAKKEIELLVVLLNKIETTKLDKIIDILQGMQKNET